MAFFDTLKKFGQSAIPTAMTRKPQTFFDTLKKFGQSAIPTAMTRKPQSMQPLAFEPQTYHRPHHSHPASATTTAMTRKPQTSGISSSMGKLYNSMINSYKNISKPTSNYSGGYSGYQATPTVNSYLQAPNDRQQQTIQSIVNTVPVKQDFRNIMKYEDYFDPSRANESALYRTKRYYEPLIEKALKNINKQYAESGLFRSGMRTNSQAESARDFAASEEEMRRQLVNQADLEARQQYAEQQRLYEASPTTYTPTVAPKINFGQASSEPEMYGTTYTDWINQLLKKY